VTAEQPASYAAMLEELESILAELEGDDVDVDLLATRVARAAELVEACRERIDRARMEVERVVATLGDRSEPQS
jgi:exodeoxyribonuclease VII small subunit